MSAGSPSPDRLSRLRSMPGSLVLGIVAAAILWVVMVALADSVDTISWAPAQDSRAYWLAQLAHPYANSTVGIPHAYLYSPAFLQVIAPLRALPWQAFVAVWALILILALACLSGPRLLLPLVLITLPEIWGANITVLMALAIVVGFRWPAAWSFVLLTKVTPGVGLLWFALRREWRQLGWALGATAAIAAASAVLMPGAWQDWIKVLTGNVGTLGTWSAIPIPLWVRMPFALAVIAWGALRNRRWALPIGCVLAMPVIWYGSLTLLVAVIPLAHPGWVDDWGETGSRLARRLVGRGEPKVTPGGAA